MLTVANFLLAVVVFSRPASVVCVVEPAREAWTAARVPKRKAEFGRRAKIMGVTLPLQLRLSKAGWYIRHKALARKRRLLRGLPPS